MNLYFRLLILLIKKLLRPERVHPLETTKIKLRVLPPDCDYNMHVTNARFFSFCDLARIGGLSDRGVVGKLLKSGVGPIVTATNASYFKDLRLFQSFEIHSKILGWDERFWFYQHDFVQNGEVKAIIMAKGFFVKARKIVPFDDVVRLSGYEVQSPALPSYVKEWSAVNDAIYQDQKNSARG